MIAGIDDHGRAETLIKTGKVRVIGTFKIQSQRPGSIFSNHPIDQKGHGATILTNLTVSREEKGDPLVTDKKKRTTYNIIIIWMFHSINKSIT